MPGWTLVAILTGCAAAAHGRTSHAPPPVNPAAARLEQTSATLDSPAVALAALPGRGVLAAACEDGAVRWWTRQPAKGLSVAGDFGQLITRHRSSATAAAANGSVLATAAMDGSILVWGIPHAKPPLMLKSAAPVRAVAITADGKTLATTGDDGGIQLWNSVSGKPAGWLEAAADWQLALAFGPAGRLLAVGGYDGRLRVWDVASRKKVVDVPAGPLQPASAPAAPTNVVSCVAFSPDGTLLVAGGSQGRIDLFQAVDGKYVRSLPGHAGPVTTVLFHPSEAVLLSGSKDRTIRLWSVSGGNLLKVLEGHAGWIQSLALLDDGTRLASAGADRTVRVWALTDLARK
jgi:WD40 repeat protein